MVPRWVLSLPIQVWILATDILFLPTYLVLVIVLGMFDALESGGGPLLDGCCRSLRMNFFACVGLPLRGSFFRYGDWCIRWSLVRVALSLLVSFFFETPSPWTANRVILIAFSEHWNYRMVGMLGRVGLSLLVLPR
ncbi:hypothetical protein Nepgr_022985 [Nepenthes gracilis]|uniref:Uncharacterized protein n=1 Tax=Nepenthes gracilis TaxID=150966 RepID=A0AAD3T191_NEPGR|nr:hypothetical protein Nepgr_022985 [Nepenthes gracilis]